MVSQTFISEDACYMRLLEKYQQYLDGELLDIDTFTSQEINSIFHKLKEINEKDAEKTVLMQNIARNSLILLLSLFPHNKNEEFYKEFSSLTADEQYTLKTELSFLI
jgi:hypothetical protein